MEKSNRYYKGVGPVKLRTGVLFLATLLVAGRSGAYADTVSDWNAIAEQAVADGGHPPVVASLDFAIVHVAIYDAVISLDRRYEPYHVVIPRASGSPEAAAAKASYDVLVYLFPAQSARLTTTFSYYLANHGISPQDPGITVGQQAAAGIISLRSNDGRFPAGQPPFMGGTAAGVWRPTASYIPGPPASLAPGLTPWVANVTPFTMRRNSQFRAEGPPDLSSALYTEDYNEVKELGARFNSGRTPEQTEIGYFWADSGPVLWQRALRNIASRYIDNIGDSARMFALVDLASADAQVACWETKYFYVFWRPVTAIQEGDSDGNPDTAGDPTWEPLINTPNFPEYTSGHVTSSSAAAEALTRFFGTDRVTFSITTAYPLALRPTRVFGRFSTAVEEVIDARVFTGIHFRTGDTHGRSQGVRVAQWVFKNYLRPLGER
jgi:hypothetical protein